MHHIARNRTSRVRTRPPILRAAASSSSLEEYPPTKLNSTFTPSTRPLPIQNRARVFRLGKCPEIEGKHELSLPPVANRPSPLNWTKVQLQIVEVQSIFWVGKSGRFENRIDFANATNVIESENQASFARSELGVEFGSERIASGLRR